MLDELRQNLKVLDELIFGNGLYDYAPVLCKKEEASTLASTLVLLASIGLEDLSGIVLRHETMEQVINLETIKPSEVTEDLWSIGLDCHVRLDDSCWSLIEFLKSIAKRTIFG